jgi:uncharacterized protein
MQGLDFTVASQPVSSHPARVDIACFVGFVARRPVAARTEGESDNAYLDRVLPGWLVNWFRDHAWQPGRDGRTAADLAHLRNVPLPVDSWDAFDELCAWDRRPLWADRFADTALGAAVRRFFAEGGRKCYVIRVGDPWPLLTRRQVRIQRADDLLPRFRSPSPMDRSTWRGLGLLFGLSDVSFLCAPDLPEIFAVDKQPIPPETDSEGIERFIECATRPDPTRSLSLRQVGAPRCDETGFREWAAWLSRAGAFLSRPGPARGSLREIQLIAALPLAVDEKSVLANPAVASMSQAQRAGAIRRRLFDAAAGQWTAAGSIQTAFVQLAYPWIRTRESGSLPGDLESPDAMLTGVLANNALGRGTWTVAARQPLPHASAVEPVLTRADLAMELPYHNSLFPPRTVLERISVFGPGTRGVQLLSDVTTDDDEAFRPANVNRLVAAVLRLARTFGDDMVFENNGPRLWRRVREAMTGLLHRLWSEGALAGASAREAYVVRCDHSTMTQRDIDAGRLMVEVRFTAAAPIARIIVVLAMDEGGQVSLVSSQGAQPVGEAA